MLLCDSSYVRVVAVNKFKKKVEPYRARVARQARIPRFYSSPFDLCATYDVVQRQGSILYQGHLLCGFVSHEPFRRKQAN